MKLQLTNVVAMASLPLAALALYGLWTQSRQISELEGEVRSLQAERDQLVLDKEVLSRQVGALNQKKDRESSRHQKRVDTLKKSGNIAYLNAEDTMSRFQELLDSEMPENQKIQRLGEIARRFVDDHVMYRSYVTGVVQVAKLEQGLDDVSGFDLAQAKANINVTMAKHKSFLETVNRWVEYTIKESPGRASMLKSTERRVSYYLTRRDQLTPVEPMQVAW
jgi:hypothetical protein